MRVKKRVSLHGDFPKLGVLFLGGPSKDYSILGSTLGSPYFRTLPHIPKSQVCTTRVLQGTRIFERSKLVEFERAYRHHNM